MSAHLRRAAASAAFACVAAAPCLAAAQATTVYGSGTPYTSAAGSPGATDPSCATSPDTWCARNVRNNAQVGVTSTYARAGNGSLYFSSPDGAGKADAELYFSSPFRLSALSGLSYDWYRAGTSTNPAGQVPSLRLILGSSTSAASYLGYLIYEPIYTESYPGNVVPADQWVTSTIGSASRFWLNGNDGTYLSLASWQAGANSGVGGRGVTGNTYVIGLSTGVGSGWNGRFAGAVDNVGYTTTGAGARSASFNFEVVPEPSTYALLTAGLAGLGAAAARRRRGA